MSNAARRDAPPGSYVANHAAGTLAAVGIERPATHALLVAGVFAVLAVVLTYPQLLHMTDAVGPHYDGLFSIWRLAWVAHALRTDPVHLFDANIFAPAPRTLTYSDAMLLPGLLGTPLVWLGADVVAVYNGLVLFSFVACGVSIYFLVAALTDSRPGAMLAGIVFTFAPFRFGHYPQLELLWSWPIPLALWALHRVLRNGRHKPALWLGLAIAAQVYSSIYFSIYLAFALALLVLLQVEQGRAPLRARARALAIAGSITVALTLPYLLSYMTAAGIVGTRSLDEVRNWSPTFARFTQTPSDNWLYGQPPGTGSLEMYLFPGLTALLTAIAGVVAGAREHARLRLSYLALLLVSIDLTRGVNGWLYATAFSYLWPLQGLRVPARMYVIASVALSVLAGIGLAGILRLLKSPRSRTTVVAVVLLACIVEYASMPLTLLGVPRPVPAIYEWLQRQPRTTILEWPVPNPAALGTTHEPEYMFYSTRHWHRLVNGYSGFYPAPYLLLLEKMKRFPSRESIAALRAIDVEFVVLHEEFAPEEYTSVRDRLGAFGDGVELATGERGDRGELTVFRIRP